VLLTGGTQMADEKNFPRVQYALFCDKVIETNEELTFKNIRNKFVVEKPKNIDINLVLRLWNITKGQHKITVNCMVIPNTELITNSFDFEVPARADSILLTQEFKETPIIEADKYIYTFLYDDIKDKFLIQFSVPIFILSRQ
jgi:hypothetical protein